MMNLDNFIYIIVVLILLYASYVDIKTRTVPRLICGILLAIAFIVNSSNIGLLIINIILTPLPFVITRLIAEKKNQKSIGGGDIKLIASIGSIIGATNSYWIIIIVFF